MKGAGRTASAGVTGRARQGRSVNGIGAIQMARAAVAVLVILIGGGNVALATDLTMTVQARGFESSIITVGPGCGVDYRVTAELEDGENQGLAAIAFDLEYSGGALAPGDAPTELPMAAFAPPSGLSNPGGFGGTLEGGRLLQVGGGQNVVMHGQWSCDADDDCPGASTCDTGLCTPISGLPVGEVVPDIGYPGAPVTVVTASVIAPSAPGVYELVVVNPTASVHEKGATGRRYWPTEAAGIGELVELSIIVQPGAGCSPTIGACCLPAGLCTSELPLECIDVLGGTSHGSGSFCEGDFDGDGTDGECGDLCPEDPLKLDPGLCGCGVEDDDTDSDGDTVPDCIDQCPGEDDLIDLNNNGIPDCLEQQQAIPTVSNWGLLVFAGLLAASAVLLLLWRRF